MHARFTAPQRLALWIGVFAALIASAKVAKIDELLTLEQFETFGITIFLIFTARACIFAAADHNENLHKKSLFQSIANASVEAITYTGALAAGWAVLRLLPL